MRPSVDSDGLETDTNTAQWAEISRLFRGKEELVSEEWTSKPQWGMDLYSSRESGFCLWAKATIASATRPAHRQFSQMHGESSVQEDSMETGCVSSNCWGV